MIGRPMAFPIIKLHPSFDASTWSQSLLQGQNYFQADLVPEQVALLSFKRLHLVVHPTWSHLFLLTDVTWVHGYQTVSGPNWTNNRFKDHFNFTFVSWWQISLTAAIFLDQLWLCPGDSPLSSWLLQNRLCSYLELPSLERSSSSCSWFYDPCDNLYTLTGLIIVMSSMCRGWCGCLISWFKTFGEAELYDQDENILLVQLDLSCSLGLWA